MREARSKLRLIKPEDMDMDEYLVLSYKLTPALLGLFSLIFVIILLHINLSPSSIALSSTMWSDIWKQRANEVIVSCLLCSITAVARWLQAVQDSVCLPADWPGALPAWKVGVWRSPPQTYFRDTWSLKVQKALIVILHVKQGKSS